MKVASKTTKNVLNFTGEKVGQLFKYGKGVASNLGEKFEKT